VQDIELSIEDMFKKWDKQADIHVEVWLVSAIKDWEKWARQRIYDTNRPIYLDIIKHLKEELADVRTKNSTSGSRVVGYKLGGNKEKNRNSRDADNLNADSQRKDLGIKKKRVYGTRGQNESGKE